VLQAREQSRAALGLPDQPGLFDAPPKRKATPYVPPTASALPLHSEAIGVLLLDEAAARLGISRRELEAMIAAGKIDTLPCGWTIVVPIREVHRLTRGILPAE
jgi:hypothetical protein